MSEQTSSFLPDLEAKLTLRDRVNWPLLLADAIHTLFITMRKENFSIDEIETIVHFIEGLIPSVFHDETYRKEIDEYTQTKKVDLRPGFGGIKLSEDVCLEMGIPPFEHRETIEPHDKFRSLINLLNRLGAITKKEYTEKFTGVRYEDAEKKEDAKTQTN